MKLSYLFLLLLLIKSSTTFPQNSGIASIDSLNKLAYEIRLRQPVKSLKLGLKALAEGKKLNYKDGMAEAHRVMGIARYHLGQNDTAINNYLAALSLFKSTNHLSGQAKVYNNLGNLYKDLDYGKGLEYFNKALKMAEKLDATDIIAGCLLNTGIIHYRKGRYEDALKSTTKSLDLYKKLNHPIGLTLSYQNLGVLFYSLKQLDKAENYLLKANSLARSANLETAIASNNLTLVEIYIAKKDLAKAYECLNEGKAAASRVQSSKLQSDFVRRSYQLENARGDYKAALIYLRKLYTQDSIELRNSASTQLALFEEQSKFEAREKENEIKLEKAKTNRVILLASVIVALLSSLLAVILVMSIRKKAKTNKQLNILNQEVSLQKANLNRVNQNLEKIIDDRTKDLKIKNRKLSEYSSHLSHQIRGPVASMKGLMILEKQQLITEEEFITEISKCVNQIDDRIMNINDALNNLSESGLIPKVVDKENE
jgi:tetratricopeptide (TPR) repeat protein